MVVVILTELVYFIWRRKKKMRLRRAPKGETLADKAHNLILTTESISSSLAGQGVDTNPADSILQEAKRLEVRGDYSSAIERAEASKLALLRAKREHQTHKTPITSPAPQPSSQVEPEYQNEEEEGPEENAVDLSKLPKNYMQAKFMLSTAKDLLDQNDIKDGEAFKHYQKAKKHFDAEDYSKALSFAIKSERLMDSETVGLIGEDEITEEVEIETATCPECDNEITSDDAFCRNCGEKLTFDTLCQGCEAELGPDDKFCRKCGQKLE
jgi:ribosomal protein L40E